MEKVVSTTPGFGQGGGNPAGSQEPAQFLFSEVHFAVVFMNINDYFSGDMKFIGNSPVVQAEFRNNVMRMIGELKYYRNCLVVCGPKPPFRVARLHWWHRSTMP